MVLFLNCYYRKIEEVALYEGEVALETVLMSAILAPVYSSPHGVRILVWTSNSERRVCSWVHGTVLGSSTARSDPPVPAVPFKIRTIPVGHNGQHRISKPITEERQD